MALVLDTATMAPKDRADAVRAAMRDARVPAMLTHETEDRVHARLDVWNLGGTTTLLRRTGTGVTLQRTPRQVRQIAEERYALVVLSPGRWRFDQRRDQRRERSARWGMLLVDHSDAYEFGRLGDSSMLAINLDHDAVGLSPDVVHRAADRLHQSPLRDLMVEHTLALARSLDAVQPGPIAQMLGTSSVELVRALITSAAHPDVPHQESDTEALLTQTKLYIQRHYSDSGLTPAQIARAHAVSVRRLYAAWSTDPQTLAEHITAVRLEAARSRLSTPGTRPPTIASVAAACGFADTAHFARRFRRAYGMAPRDWRRHT